MIYVQFYIRFNSQLKRTKPEIINNLNKNIDEAVLACGGIAENSRKGLIVSFNQNKIGTYLNILIFLEKVNYILKNFSPELFGYALILGQDIDEIGSLCQALSLENMPGATGIWCDNESRKNLNFYAHFSESNSKYLYSEIKNFVEFGINLNNQGTRSYIDILQNEQNRNTIITGNSINEIRQIIYTYSRILLKNIPPLIVRFGEDRKICFADAYSPVSRSFIYSVSGESVCKNLDQLHAQLSVERLRDEWPPYINKQSRDFFSSLVNSYIMSIKPGEGRGLLILDEPGLADEETSEFLRALIKSINGRITILVCSSEMGGSWKELFFRSINHKKNDENVNIARENLPVDIMEAAYNISLLGNFFPVHMFPDLFEEEGLNREIYFKTLEVLSGHGMLVPEDPVPEININGFLKLDKNCRDRVSYTVRNLLISWLASGRLRPCFNMVKILSELGERASNEIVIRSIRGDVLNGTWSGINKAIKGSYFSSLVGENNASALEYIFHTLKALVWGEEEEIHRVFQEPLPSMNCYEACQVHVYSNLSAFYIGIGNGNAASDALRKAMHINRSLGKNAIPAFRFFSLANLSRQKMDDALEYISFALDQAEKNEQMEELFIASYYASSIFFIHGNLSRAERLSLRSEEIAASLGQSRWLSRIKFFRGRIYFEMGRYREALEIFKSLESMSSYMAETINAWIYRTNNFMSGFSAIDSAIHIDENLSGIDGKFFAIEAAYHTGDYQRAVSLAEDFLLSPEARKDNFLFTEQPDWNSGFSQCEYLLQNDKVPGTRLVWIYRLMSQCALQGGREGMLVNLGSMQRFMRDELLPETDPFDAIYFHGWLCMLRNSGNVSPSYGTEKLNSDLNNILSMAFRRLRRRWDRIDVREIRQSIFELPLWNNILYLAAKEYKAI